MILELHEAQTALWKKIKASAEDRLEMLRLKNDGNLGPEETARLRGRIAELKSFIDLDKPDQALSNAGDEPPFEEW